jgi:glycosyltransferase involved in cell wall biosynthesis
VNGAGKTPGIEVLLATCNGARHLPAQLDSLLEQTLRGFTVLASDDGSSDETLAILERYAANYPGFLTVLPAAGHRLGASANFGRLLDAARADCVAFCDQDDIWHPDKLEVSLALMRQIEADQGPDYPVLVHTDLTVVDADLNSLGASFWRYVGINPARQEFGDLLLGNIATGCTLLANRALYEAARPIPDFALMFDFWLAQVAAGVGRIACLNQPTVLYRQHSGNLIGAQRSGSASFFARVKRTLLSDKTLRVLSSFSVHAAELHARYAGRLSAEHRNQALTLARVWERPFHLRFASLAASGLRKPGFAANVALFLLLLRRTRPVPAKGKS